MGVQLADSRICTVDGCDKKLFCKGLCRTHYNKSIPAKRCQVEGCETPAGNNMKLCWKHYSRASKHGDPKHETFSEEVQKFIKSAAECKDEACLFWPFPREPNPRQPRVSVNVDGKTRFASRHICQLAHGEPPTPKHVAAHSCGNGHLDCMNASHLRWATQQENVDDMLIHGTRAYGEDSPTAILTNDQAKQTKRMLSDGVPISKIASMYDVTWACIHAIKVGRNWKTIDP